MGLFMRCWMGEGKKTEDELKNEDNLKTEDDLKNPYALKIEDNLKNEDNIKTKEDLKNDDDLKMKTTSFWRLCPAQAYTILVVLVLEYDSA